MKKYTSDIETMRMKTIERDVYIRPGHLNTPALAHMRMLLTIIVSHTREGTSLNLILSFHNYFHYLFMWRLVKQQSLFNSSLLSLKKNVFNATRNPFKMSESDHYNNHSRIRKVNHGL